MKQARWIVVASTLVLSATWPMACAVATDNDAPIDVHAPDAKSDASVVVESDASDAITDGAVDADAGLPTTCSPAGLCQVDLSQAQVDPADEAAVRAAQFYAIWSDGSGNLYIGGRCGPLDTQNSPTSTCLLRLRGQKLELLFSKPASDAISSIWASGPNDVWASSTTGLWHGEGADPTKLTWTAVTFPSALGLANVRRYCPVWGSGPNDVWAPIVTNSGAIRIAHFGTVDAGVADWSVDEQASSLSSGGWGTCPMLTGRSSNDVWIGAAGHIVHRDGSGTWTDVTPPTSVYAQIDWNGSSTYATAAFSAASNQAWFGALLSYGDGYRNYPVRVVLPDDGGAPVGTDFSSVNDTYSDGVYAEIYAFWGTSASDVWMGANYGRVQHWDGTKWSFVGIAPAGSVTPLLADVRGIWGSGAPKDVWFVANTTQPVGKAMLRRGFLIHLDPTKGVNP
ncbi:hypothetical protein AKJ09_02355 [Labilithrix luteola]|uniref:Type IV fimbrial biogenesis protein PilY1 n=1 Tax=Labilithrix luteola TaxID=1391654 RepID=A0A0K1PQN4_9BACT|nr:hypothetical protein [Labilithrix luteola]AKU95691.1 hypothetical protein AKJ09_02355 [Labilithrix luteola]